MCIPPLFFPRNLEMEVPEWHCGPKGEPEPLSLAATARGAAAALRAFDQGSYAVMRGASTSLAACLSFLDFSCFRQTRVRPCSSFFATVAA